MHHTIRPHIDWSEAVCVTTTDLQLLIPKSDQLTPHLHCGRRSVPEDTECYMVTAVVASVGSRI